MSSSSTSSTLNGEPSWSPVQCLPPALLTPSGLLQLDGDDGEVELMRRDMVELKSDGDEPLPNPGMGGIWMNRNVNLTLTLTTHRTVFTNQKEKKGAWFLHHSSVHTIASTGGGMFKTAKTVLKTHALGDLLLTFRGNPHRDRGDFQKLLQQALDRKAWQTTERLAQKQKVAASSSNVSRKVGVDAILAKNALRHKEAAKLTDAAFDGDADALLSEAAELVKIIQKYVSTLEHSGESNHHPEEQAQLTDMLSNMGMTSALSKSEMSQNTFYQLLARQLADFLLPKLKAAGGVMTLTDVYCLFNRARGTNLISPDDLLHAASLLADLSLQMALHTFPSSGVKVIQQDAFDNVTMAKTLNQLSMQQPLTSLQVSRDLHIPSLLAQEQLLAAERLGYLCRDVTLETTRFYPNRFLQEYSSS